MTEIKKPAAKPAPKKKMAKKYRPECKRCKHVAERAYPASAVRANLTGKNPFSCENCGAKIGYKWLPVAEA